MVPAPVRHGVAVARRLADSADIPLLRNLYADSRPELAVLPPDTRDVLVDMQFRAQRRRFAAQYPDATDEILVVDGVEAGRIVLDRHPASIRIVDICVGLGQRRQGLASAVIADIVAEAAEDRRRVWLTVWSTNTAMRAVARRAGLEVMAAEDGVLTLGTS